MSQPPYSRREILRTAAAGSAVALGAGTASGTSPDDRVTSQDFEEREWGYVRSDYDPPERSEVPIILGMEGYEGAAAPTHYLRMRDDTLIAVNLEGPTHRGTPNISDNYLEVSASIRGTGCSGGTFDLFDRVHARDGREIIEWLSDRPWSVDRVGLYGASYSGITALFIASTRPPSLGAVSANLVIGDLYRGVAYPGGVPNTAFPALWNGYARPEGNIGGTQAGLEAGDEICAQNVAGRQPLTPVDNPLLVPYLRRRDDTAYQMRSPVTFADRIEAPTFISQSWQDEQTGPRGGTVMFNAIDPVPAARPGTKSPVHESPKLFRAANGIHNTGGPIGEHDQSWFDYWLLGKDTGIMDEPAVELFVGRGASEESLGRVGLKEFPIRDDDIWERFYFSGDGLSRTPPETAASEQYLSGGQRQSWVFTESTIPDQMAQAVRAARPVTNAVRLADGPDLLSYRSDPVTEPRMIAGPMCATLFVETTTPDTDFYLKVFDEGPDGGLTPLQRGLLRGSHRMIDEERSWYTDEGTLIRPYRPHRNTTLLTPGEVTRFDVEVFPLGHLLYPDHRLVVTVGSPPVVDGLWGYEPTDLPGMNTLHTSPEHPSSIVVPLLEWDGPVPDEPSCGEPEGYRCIEGSL